MIDIHNTSGGVFHEIQSTTARYPNKPRLKQTPMTPVPLDAITVTGSRISVPGVEASSPVANVERAEFLTLWRCCPQECCGGWMSRSGGLVDDVIARHLHSPGKVKIRRPFP